MDINKAMVTLQNFLEKGNVIYAVNCNGEIFTLENGCLLLTVNNSRMPVFVKEV